MRITDNYFIGGPLDGSRSSGRVYGDYFMYDTLNYDTAVWVVELTQEEREKTIKKSTHIYQRHHEFPYIFLYQGDDTPNMTKVHGEDVLEAIDNFYKSEYLYGLRYSTFATLNKKAEQMMLEADDYWEQASHSDDWVCCGEKMLEFIKEYGGINGKLYAD